MQYFQMIMLGIQLVTYLIKVISEFKSSGTFSDGTLDGLEPVLVALGKLTKFDGLSEVNIATLMPQLRAMLPMLLELFRDEEVARAIR